jgi:hypothetical protein
MNGKLACKLKKTSPTGEDTLGPCQGQVDSASVEQISDNRCCIKVDGKFLLPHRETPFFFTAGFLAEISAESRSWFPG